MIWGQEVKNIFRTLNQKKKKKRQHKLEETMTTIKQGEDGK